MSAYRSGAIVRWLRHPAVSKTSTISSARLPTGAAVFRRIGDRSSAGFCVGHAWRQTGLDPIPQLAVTRFCRNRHGRYANATTLRAVLDGHTAAAGTRPRQLLAKEKGHGLYYGASAQCVAPALPDQS